MIRRKLLSTALVGFAAPMLASFPVRAEPKPNLSFDEMYAGYSVLGLKLSEKLKSLAGKKVTILGFMAPPLKADAKFFVLTKEPVSLCPFCSTDADWPESIIVVFLSEKQDFVQANRIIAVTGTLELGSRMDEETGFVSLVRLVNARFEVI